MNKLTFSYNNNNNLYSVQLAVAIDNTERETGEIIDITVFLVKF